MATQDRRLTGGELVVSALTAAGVGEVFALHGGHHEALFKACTEAGIRLIDVRHEATAGHAADAYARTTGRLGVCIVTAGPGFTNAISAISNAYLDGSPVLFLIGAPPVREIETNPMQGGIDQIAMIRPSAKWAISITSTERIADLTAMAIRKAMSGRKGPVVVELPIDVLHMSIPASSATRPAGVSVQPRPAPSPRETRRLADMVSQARRPVIIAGLEAAEADVGPALRELCDKTGIPVFTKPQAMGLLGSDHPCDGGAPGNLAAAAGLGVEPPDLVILIGARLGLLLGGRSGAIVPHASRLVQVSLDAGEIGRIRDVDLAIQAHCAEAIGALTEALSAQGASCDVCEWRNRAVSARNLFAGAFPEARSTGGIHPFHAARAACEAAGPEAVYALDGGESGSWASAAVRVSAPGRVLTHGYLGCLGIGPGFSIGAQIAHPDRRVVQITGDGTMGFHVGDLDTLVRHGLPVVTVVLNNQVWGMSIHGQQLMYGANYNVITKLGQARYADIARAFGCYSERIEDPAEVGPAVRRALDSQRPALIEVMTDPQVVHPVTTSMLGAIAEGSGEVMIPYYENIPGGAG